ncbi:hypothetical protein [Sorangium sp. So ce131]|uniref:hypothetical protein n=1 Tax=Sorangium sp. So ce131 TaxID=3133282 RepID=UPI003F6317E7
MRLLLVLSLSLAAGCGSTPSAPGDYAARGDIFSAAGPSEFLLVSARGEIVSADVEPGQVVGPDVNLGLYDHGKPGRPGDERAEQAIRGIAFNRAVSVAATGQRAAGVVGAMPLELTVTRAEAGLRARGLLAGALSDYRLDERQLTGVVGRCSYDLARAGRVYEGSRSCGGQPHRVTVLVPRALSAPSSWGDAALATALGLLLGA